MTLPARILPRFQMEENLIYIYIIISSYFQFHYLCFSGLFKLELVYGLFFFLLIRERTVASLVSLGAAPGALTDPSPKHQTGGKTPSDLAYAKGHKGIAGYLAESALSAHLSSLNLDKKEGNAAETSGTKAVHTVSERVATPVKDGDLTDRLSLKDSLAAVCNATQAAARIHQVFRVQSFQRKQLKEYGDNKFGMSDEQALSLIAVKTAKQGHDEHVNAAATRIQNKFRSWKGRKDFLIIRQRIVKIQVYDLVPFFFSLGVCALIFSFVEANIYKQFLKLTFSFIDKRPM